METIIALFEHYDDADAAVRELYQYGFEKEDINVLAREQVVQEQWPPEKDQLDAPGTTHIGLGMGLVGGASIGGLGGLLIGMGAFAIPGMGPAFVVGTMLAAIATGAGMGVMAGGLLAFLSSMGVPEEEAHLYAEGVKRGGILVAVHAPNESAPHVEEVFQNAGGVSIDVLRGELAETGWERFDENTLPGKDYPRLRGNRGRNNNEEHQQIVE
jgi:hypothetical protein